MLDWLSGLLPFAEEYAFLSNLTAAVLVVAFACIALSAFMGIFTAIFRR